MTMYIQDKSLENELKERVLVYPELDAGARSLLETDLRAAFDCWMDALDADGRPADCDTDTAITRLEIRRALSGVAAIRERDADWAALMDYLVGIRHTMTASQRERLDAMTDFLAHFYIAYPSQQDLCC